MTRSPFYFSRVGTLIFKMNRARQDQFLRVHFILIFMMLLADHFCKMPIKKFTAVWGNVTFCLWSWPPSEYFQKWENFVVELCHLWCFSSRKQQTINRRLDYLEAFKMKRPVVYFDPFKPPFLMVHYCATCCLFFWCMDGRAVTIWNPTQAILCKGLEGSLSQV